MPYPTFRAASFDDLLREVYPDVLSNGEWTEPTQGKAKERRGMLLELTNPLARLSRTETRGRLFSCLGELLWYLAGSREAAFIQHYITDYPGSDASGTMPGAYGPRLFEGGSNSQFQRVARLLVAKPDSRQAVLQIFDKKDLETGQEDVPCTCTLQFMARRGMLDLIVHMRSNDAVKGLTHDIFCFTMLQEIMARDLSLTLGTYRHFIGSLHIYEQDVGKVRDFIQEGWQSLMPMPPMPARPWDGIPIVLRAEKLARQGGDPTELLRGLDTYWADIVRLLMVFSYTKSGDRAAAAAVGRAIQSETYGVFVDARISRSA